MSLRRVSRNLLLSFIKVSRSSGHPPLKEYILSEARNVGIEYSTTKCVMSSTANRDLFYEDIVKLSANKEIYLIDVREPAEILETGKLPGSVHIPLGDVPSALALDPSSFELKYGSKKPEFDSSLVFSCRSGKRSQIALKGALDLGYSKSRHYAGGWLDWEAHNKQNK